MFGDQRFGAAGFRRNELEQERPSGGAACLIRPAPQAEMARATVQGSPVSIGATDGAVKVDEATVTQADIETDNGVIHVTDRVITTEMRCRPRRAGSAGRGAAGLPAAPPDGEARDRQAPLHSLVGCVRARETAR